MIKAETTYTHEHFLALSKYARSGAKYKSAFRGAILLAAVPAVLLARELILSSFSIMTIFDVCVWGYLIVAFCMVLRKFIAKPKPPVDTFRFELFFDEEDFWFTCNCTSYDSERHRRYESIHSAVEWQGWLFVYLTANEVCIMRTTDLTAGTPDELRTFLKDKLGTRYINYALRITNYEL